VDCGEPKHIRALLIAWTIHVKQKSGREEAVCNARGSVMDSGSEILHLFFGIESWSLEECAWKHGPCAQHIVSRSISPVSTLFAIKLLLCLCAVMMIPFSGIQEAKP
jgi:hypothetical protein